MAMKRMISTLTLLLAPPAALHAAEFCVADIAPSAYQYRADRKAEENAPESWLAVMRFAGQPLNKPADTNSPAVQRVLCALLWEEIRPIRQVELTWPADEKRRPATEAVQITTLDNQGTASSWWNNLQAEKKPVTPASADGGSKLVFNLSHNTCGLVISVGGDKLAADYAVPAVRVLVADRWKKMDIEIEWGYDAASAQKDYSGRIETYDGIVGELAPLDGDAGTTVGDRTSWHSSAKAGTRRGVKASLLYMGTSKWRKAIPFTSQPEDVARTIVTVWSKSGSFSFLAADLEHGPILAPEYGFFVRRTSALPAPAPASAASTAPALASTLLASKMDNLLGNTDLRGWGQAASPWFAVNRGEAATVQGITFPARGAAMHPGSDCDVAVAWKSPFDGKIGVRGKATHIQPGGGDGVTWSIAHETFGKTSTLAEGVLDQGGSQTIANVAKLTEIAVRKDDRILLTVGRRGGHQCDSTAVELVITEPGGQGRTWDLLRDVADNVLAGNPLPDSHGNAGVWALVTLPAASPAAASVPHTPPFDLASQATSASEFVKELQRAQPQHDPPTPPRASGTDLARGGHGHARVQPASSSRATRRIRTGDAGAGAVRTAHRPVEPGPVAPDPPLREEPGERTALVQRPPVRHPGRRDLHDPGRAGHAGGSQGRGGRIPPVGFAAPGSRLPGTSPLGPC